MPSHEVSLEQQQRTEFLRSLSRVGTTFALLLVPGYALGLHFYAGALSLILAALIFALLPWIARRTSIAVSAHLAALAFTGGVSIFAFVRGDLPLGALVFLILSPVVLAYLVGPKAAMGWALVGVIVIGVVLWRVETGRAHTLPQLETPEALAQKNGFEAFGLIGMLLLMTSMALSVDRRRRVVEQERLRLLKELNERAAGARLGRLASGVAHEINNPLAWMTSGLSFLQERFSSDPDPEVGEVIGDVVQGAQRLAVIVSDLQAVSYRDTLPTDAADPVRVLRIVKSLATAEVGRRGVLKVETPAHLPRIRGNEGALAELLLELVLDSTSKDVLLNAESLEGRVVFLLSPVIATEFDRARSMLSTWGGGVEVIAGVARLSLPTLSRARRLGHSSAVTRSSSA
ncbi:MAG: histidine kinase dimerization/phospho-acceptor domain-containing protein [Archangium sp.]|nr:histidine kinase dimerization/phospho-acceptor domain-containing protein [Archangium sp.]